MIIRTIFVAVLACATLAHSQPRDSHPSFDAASLKPANVARNESRIRGGGPGTATPGRFSDSNISLQNLLMLAYGVTRSQIVGPSWIETSKYAISVNMPRNTTVEQFHLMLQDLLAERFALELHHQTRDVPVFTLEPAPGGPKIGKWQNSDSRPDSTIAHGNPGTTIPRGLTLDEKGFPILPTQYTFAYTWINTPLWFVRAACRGCTVAEFIQNLRAPVLARMWYSGTILDTDPMPLVDDKTGLAGKLNFNLEFEQLIALPIIHDPSSGLSLAEALEKELGLRLEKGKKAPMDVLVVDHAEKTPTAN